MQGVTSAVISQRGALVDPGTCREGVSLANSEVFELSHGSSHEKALLSSFSGVSMMEEDGSQRLSHPLPFALELEVIFHHYPSFLL
jgi:hypothetical protein